MDVVDPFIKAFEAELSALGFNRFTVKVDTRNRSGHQQFKLALEQSGEPVVSKVASEGEQRCIALASFFADMRADGRRSAVIFDDPVNSLSHQWRAVIARRLVNESAYRQVIVFTHDLVFYKWLIEEAELRGVPHAELSLDRSRSTAGFVRTSPPGMHSPRENVSENSGQTWCNSESMSVKKRSCSRTFCARLVCFTESCVKPENAY